MAENFTQFSEMIECETEEQVQFLLAKLNKKGDSGQCCEAKREGLKDVWIHSDENPDLEQMVDVLCEFQKKFKLKKPIVISWAHSCSKPRLSEFGGGAVVIMRGKEYWIDAATWAHRQVYKRQKMRKK